MKNYPFAAIVGQPEMKLALLLAAVDWRLSVLLKGDKGSGKSTAARAVAEILPVGAPFVNLPIGTTEDRLLGGLNLGEALEGQAKLKHGLVQEAHGGVLYIDEVNLLSDSLTDALLDVASSGLLYVERDGFSASADARFVLLGSMNIEEGALRPQFTDRFALSLEVEAPAAAQERAAIMESRLWFDSSPDTFCAAHEKEQLRLRQAIVEARRLTPGFKASSEILRTISEAVTDAGVRSLRADLAALRAATAHAALAGRTDISAEDVEAVVPLVLNHRAKRNPGKPPPPPQSDPRQRRDEKQNEDRSEHAGSHDRVFPLERREAPELRLNLADSISRGRTASVDLTSEAPLDVVASFTQSFRNTGTASLRTDQLVFRTPPVKSGVRFVFVVDASGSQAAQQRMRAVKGAAAALLESSVDHKDEVAVITFRGAKAEIVLEPCRDPEAAMRVLEFLPTGGRTPLAHALRLAGSLVNPTSLLILLTDGRANVALTTDDPWQDALDEAGRLSCLSVLVDSSIDSHEGIAMKTLASALGGTQIHLDELSKETLMNVLRR
jgi:magnesium chelatase subunit D